MTTRRRNTWQATLYVCSGGLFVWGFGLAGMLVIG
jgi:hypothetical protein|tara:strand:- start:142 stop:246 length:105 start_codon:yes stop_codon:yes gene_type:complete